MNKKNTLKIIISIFLIFISMLLLFTIYWGQDFFQIQSFDQIVFHLKVPLEGTNSDVFNNWFENVPLKTFFSTVLIAVIVFNPLHLSLGKFFDKLSNILKHQSILFSILLLVPILVYGALLYSIPEYFSNQFSSTTIYEDYYVAPQDVKLTFPEKKRNLIYIYVESLETTFSTNEKLGDSDIYGGGYQTQDLMPELVQLAKDNINFSNVELSLGGAYQVSNVGWTIAAIVAQRAGIPLNIPIEGNSYGDFTSFLPGAYSLGQILEHAGYTSEIMVGSDIAFGGRKNFYEQHGNYNIFDLNTARELKKIPEDYVVWWGFEDSKLFEYAKEDITNLASQDEPFYFEMLTTDTHHPEGYLEPFCPTPYESNYENAISCSSTMIADFIAWIQTQDFYENTTVIISGDHLSMNTSYMDTVDDYTRTVFNIFINAAAQTDAGTTREFTTLDLYPTTLAALGVQIDGNKLGLGTNLFSQEQTLVELLGIDTLNKELSKHSKYYDKHILQGK